MFDVIQNFYWGGKMENKLLTIKCPGCGANLNIEEGRNECFCSYCGSKILINDTKEYIYHTIDEAKIREVESNERIRLKQLEFEYELKRKEANKKPKMIKTIIADFMFLGAFLYFLVAIMGLITLKNNPDSLLIGLMFLVFGIIFLLIGLALWKSAHKY